MKTFKTFLFAVLSISSLTFVSQQLQAHCQIPCGIYSDDVRVELMLEDGDTVLKATKLIGELAGKTDAQSQQQLVRWVTNKESHAQKIIETISDYYLTQRVKPSQADYVERLKKHHAIILAAMKAKQSSGAEAAEALIAAIKEIAPYYPHTH